MREYYMGKTKILRDWYEWSDSELEEVQKEYSEVSAKIIEKIFLDIYRRVYRRGYFAGHSAGSLACKRSDVLEHFVRMEEEDGIQ
jgi:hypothetical protein